MRRRGAKDKDAAPVPEHFKPREVKPRSRKPAAAEPAEVFEEEGGLLDDGALPLDAEPYEPDPKRRRPPPMVLAQVLDSVVQKLRLNVSPVAEMLREKWGELLPKELASRCQPGKIHNGILYVYVADSSVLFELRGEVPRIEAALRGALANTKVRQVRLMVNRVD